MKKRMLSILLIAALGIALVPAAASATGDRGSFNYEQIIEPQYEDASIFNENLAAVRKDGKWGYIDKDNNVVIPFIYGYASFFAEGLAVVGVLEPQEYNRWDWETLQSVPDVRDVVSLGRIDKEGNFIPFKYNAYDWDSDSYKMENLSYETDWFDFSERYYYCGGWVNVVHGIYDRNGNEFKAPDGYGARYVPTEGLVAGWKWDDEAGLVYMDLSGKIVLDLTGFKHYDADWKEVKIDDYDWDNYTEDSYDQWSKQWDRVRYERFFADGLPFNQGMALAWECTYDLEDYDSTYRYGFINKSGKWVIEPQFDYYWISDLYGSSQSFNSGGLASVGRDGKHGAIDKTGKAVVPLQYDDMMLFFEGVAPFKQNGRYGYVDTTGNVVIPAKFTATSGFSNGIAVASDGTKSFLIDRTGTMISGSDKIDLSNYFYETDSGMRSHAPGEYVTISSGDKYGFGKIAFVPPLPAPAEMDVWAYAEVIAAIEAELVPASLQNLFRSNISRIDYSLLVVHALGTILEMERDELVLAKTGKSMDSWVSEFPFSDSASSNVIAAYALGLVQGYEDGTFRPFNSISRAEAAVLLWRAANVLEMDNKNAPQSDFTDRDKIPSWAQKEVDYVYSVGVMRGDQGAFSPTGNYTRQQSYMTIYRMLLALLDEQ